MLYSLPSGIGYLVRFPRLGRAAGPEAPLVSRTFAGAYLTTMRPYLFFVSGITGILMM